MNHPRFSVRLSTVLLVCLSAVLHGHGTEPTPAAVAPANATGQNENASDISPEVESLLKLAGNLTDRGDYSAAEIAYRQILHSPLSKRAEHQMGLIGYARMFRRQGSFTKAAAIFEKFLKEFPEDERVPDVYLDLGRTLRAMGAHRLAVNRFYSVINSTLKLPTDSFDHYQLLARTAQFEIAETYFESGNFVEAGKFFSRLRLLDLAPVDRARAHFKSSYSMLLAGDQLGSIRAMHAYLLQWPNDEHVPEARHLLATTLRQLNRTDEALYVTMELLRGEQAQSKADPKRWSYWQRRTGNQLANEFFHSGETTNALTIYQRLLSLAPDPSWRLPVLYQVGLCYERLRALDRAREAYQKIVDEAPATNNVELNDLAKMSAWRINNMIWLDQTEQKLNAFFPASPDGTPTFEFFPTAHDAPASPAAPPTTL